MYCCVGSPLVCVLCGAVAVRCRVWLLSLCGCIGLDVGLRTSAVLCLREPFVRVCVGLARWEL